MENVLGTSEISLQVFGGLDSELQPTDCPQGISPDLENVAFLPGSVFTRPPLTSLLSFPGNVQIAYAKSYLKPDGTTAQFVVDSLGRMWADGVQIGTTRAGNRVKSVTAFGREYIAVSDGLHGADVPLQFDGTHLDRVSQDGPGAACTLANYAVPASSLVAGSAGASVVVSTATPSSPTQVQIDPGQPDDGGYIPPQYETIYQTIVFATAAPHGLSVGQNIAISGNTLWNFAAANVLQVIDPSTFSVSVYAYSSAVGTGGAVTPYTPLLSRSNNRVTAYTASAHQLRVGYQVKIDGVDDYSQTIATLVIDQVNKPGIATITTTSPHGLVPGNSIGLNGLTNITVGGSITAWQVADQVAQVTTSAPHGLVAGNDILLQFNALPYAPRTVASVPSANTFTCDIPGGPNQTGSSGNVMLAWPGANGQQYAVQSIISTTQFTVAIPTTYPSATWTSGSFNFPWDGVFYVTAVPSPTSFRYAQSGPSAIVSTGTGTATPVGQISPGRHNCVVIFQTRQGYLTVPSPTVRLYASGGQYIIADNIPIGPSNVIARILAFTSANGSRYFYIPVPVRNAGIVISSSTVVNDNSTTSAIFDFSDQALISATAIDIPGNNLFAQVVLGPCLGFFAYASRMFTWGERNKVQKFRNMGFEGGVYASDPNSPLGWTISGTGTLTTGDYGYGWKPDGAATISQPAYQDEYGLPIIKSKTKYIFRAWSLGSATAELSAASTGFSSKATISPAGGFAEAQFSLEMPEVIPQDLILSIYGTNTMDELEIIYAESPYLMVARGSYANNPEAFDDVTGRIGPSSDPNEICSLFERKDVLHFLTRGPNGSLYQTQDTASSEPSTWNFGHVAAKCGGISVWGDAQFEDWHVWASDTGLRIYDGGNVEKMSQEVQPWWNSFQMTAKQFTVVANDPYFRRIYVGAVTGTGHTVPDSWYVMDYRELNTAAMLSGSGPLKLGRSGGLFTTDLSRKWSPWSITANFCGLMDFNGGARMVFCAGNGTSLSGSGYGKVYGLLEGDISGVDDDYGPFITRYTTYFFVDPEEAQAARMLPHRKLHVYMAASVSGIGKLKITPLVNGLANAWPVQLPRLPLQAVSTFEIECGLNVQGERVAYRLESQANDGQQQSGFNLNSFTMSMRTDPWSPIRGAY